MRALAVFAFLLSTSFALAQDERPAGQEKDGPPGAGHTSSAASTMPRSASGFNGTRPLNPPRDADQPPSKDAPTK